MKKLFALFLLPISLWGQVIPPAATQAEVDAGVNRFKYVTPFTLNNTSNTNVAGGGGGTPGGFSGAVQFNQSATFAGTNRFVYDRTNETLTLLGASAGSLQLLDDDGSHGVKLIAPATLSSNLNITFPTGVSNGLMRLSSVNDSNFTLLVTDTIDRLFYSSLPFNGSNGTSAIALTNNWDLFLQTFRPITNVVGTNLTFNLSNVTVGASGITTMKGIGGYSNLVTFLAVAGVNIRWMNWATNGNYDIQTRPGFNYVVQFFANSATNVNAWVSTDDIYVSVSSLFHAASNSAITLLTATNIYIRGGASSSNVTVGGTLFFDLTSYTNHSTVGAHTNFAKFTNSAHLLTNNGGRIVAAFRGTLTTGTNQIQIGYGSATNVLDTGVFTNLGLKVWEARIEITRSGNTGQHIDGRIHWDAGGGVPFSYTNFNKEIAETNGIATRLFASGQTIGLGKITNNFLKVLYEPASR